MNQLYISKDFTFDAAHNLTEYHGKCEKLHGHTWRVKVTIKGPIKADGMVMDFVELKKVVKEHCIDHLDHAYLNDLFPQPSAENICLWLWEQLKDKVLLHEVKVWESPTSCANYRGE